MADTVALNDAGRQWLADLTEDAASTVAVVTPTGPAEPIRRLIDQHDRDGKVSNEAVAAVAAEVGLSARQLRRRIAAYRATGTATRTRSYELNDDHMQVIFAHCGNVAAARRDLVRAGKPVPHLNTFRARWDEQPAHIRAFARDGAAGARAMWLHTRYETAARNTIWYADHFELPVDVIADGQRTTTMKPWLTLFEDDKTRRIMAWAISANVGRRVGADVVVACLAEGIRTRTIGGETVGGVPERVLWDNALEFLAGEVTQFATLLGFEAVAVRPYSGHLKGKVERLGQTVQVDFCTTLNGYTHGPDTYTRVMPFRETSTPMTADVLRARFENWVQDYNERRPRSSLAGQTPHDVWAADPASLRLVPDTKLRSGLLVAPKPHKVQNTGVYFRRQWWLGAGLVHHVNRTVEIRYPIDRDAGFIEIFYGGTWLCTAQPAVTLSEDEKRRILASRHDQYELARDLQRAAKRRREATNAAAAADGTNTVGRSRSADPYARSLDDLLNLTGTDGAATVGGNVAMNDGTSAHDNTKKNTKTKRTRRSTT